MLISQSYGTKGKAPPDKKDEGQSRCYTTRVVLHVDASTGVLGV